MRPTRLVAEATDGAARTGYLETARGRFATPCFMPVGTRGAVKLLTSEDLSALGIEVILANTYHLMLRPGAQTVAAVGGLHRFESWSGQILTDSGGFQVFSLGAKVDDDGVTFRSTYDGSTHRLSPESAVQTQESLGADIQMALDVCSGLPAEDAVIRVAMERTADWARRARQQHGRRDQSLFGIVQGGIHLKMRAESAARTAELDFDGYGIGGLSVGESRTSMLPALAAAVGQLPADRPRYLMGVGDPISIVEAVAQGVDMFDCVLPTRLGRHGTALTNEGKVQLKKVAWARSEDPIDTTCACSVCARYSRAYLRHLLVVAEPTGARLVTVHNLAWLLALVARIRQSIRDGSLTCLRAEIAAHWEPASPR